MDMKETTKKLNFSGIKVQDNDQESNQPTFKIVSHFQDEEDESIVIDLAKEEFDSSHSSFKDI